MREQRDRQSHGGLPHSPETIAPPAGEEYSFFSESELLQDPVTDTTAVLLGGSGE